MLYRVSTGHAGVLCESCHVATHAIFPNVNPNANDNVASMQLQGHAGLISECDTCHIGDLGETLDGPHGMHAVGSAGRKLAEGTALSAMLTDRVLECKDEILFCPNENSQLYPKGHQVTCTDCHDNDL